MQRSDIGIQNYMEPKIHTYTENLFTKSYYDSLKNAVRHYDKYKQIGKVPPPSSDDYGLYKYGEWITENYL